MKISIKKTLAVIIPVIAVIIYFIIQSGDSDVPGNTAKPKDVDYGSLGEVVFDVKAATVKRDDLILNVNSNGIIKPNNEIEVSSKLSESIVELNVYEGKRVKKGDVLLRLDSREYELAVEEAESALLKAKVELALLYKTSPIEFSQQSKADSIKNEINELKDLFKAGKLSDEQFEAMNEKLDLEYILTGIMRDNVLKSRSGYTSAMNSLKRSKLNLEYTEIRAPFSGVISDFDLSIGQRVNAGAKLFNLIDDSILKIETGVIESEAVKINNGALAKVFINAFNDDVFFGKVKYVSPEVNPETKTCKVIIELDNASRKIKPGMYSELLIEVERLKNRILIPREALLVRDKRNLVFMAEDSLAKWNYVDIGKQNDEYIEVLSGKNQPIEPGMLVLVDGQYTLDHDAKINITSIDE